MDYCKAGKPDMALMLLTKAIHADENNDTDGLLHHLYWSRSNVYMDLESYELALLDIDEACRLCPDEWGAMIFDRIEIYKKMQEYDLAIADLTESINEYTVKHEKKKDYGDLIFLSDLYQDRGDLYAKKLRQDLARQDHDKASEIQMLYDHEWHISYSVRCLYFKDKKNIKARLKNINTKELEQMAVELYERGSKLINESKEKTDEIINLILYTRSVRLNKHHIWTEENVKGLLRVDELLVSAFRKALVYARSIEDEIKMKNNDFAMDYEIKIKLNPYIRDSKDDIIDNSFMFILCEPAEKQYEEVLTGSIHHASKYLEKNPLYNCNASCYFRDKENKPIDCFKDHYISYAIVELLDTGIWSFKDIINIDRVCTEVIVNYQAFIGNYPVD